MKITVAVLATGKHSCLSACILHCAYPNKTWANGADFLYTAHSKTQKQMHHDLTEQCGGGIIGCYSIAKVGVVAPRLSNTIVAMILSLGSASITVFLHSTE